jgi:alkylhydroperoxidase family enzyme
MREHVVMSQRPTTPRLLPLAPDERSEDQRELLSSLGGENALNIFATLARHPGLFRRWMPFGGKLLQGSKLPARDRELIILRVAYRCAAGYEWAQHVTIARAAGLTDGEIRQVGRGPDHASWAAADRTLLCAVDELHDDHCITDATWTALAKAYTEQQLIEIPMLAGHYALLAGVLNSLGVEPEGPHPALGET